MEEECVVSGECLVQSMQSPACCPPWGGGASMVDLVGVAGAMGRVAALACETKTGSLRGGLSECGGRGAPASAGRKLVKSWVA
eukprot:scaffold34759_cov37-Tisochrysis_lutea.AAC.4